MLKATYRLSVAFPCLIRSVFITMSLCLMPFQPLSQPVIAQVAPGVQQSAAQAGTVTGSVTQSDGTPVTGANVQLGGPGAHLTTQSDAHGTFAFTSVPYGTYTIVATVANLGTATRNLVIKGDIAVTIQYVAQNDAGGLKEIARVSTHSTGASINVTPASIASVNPNDYAFQGNTSWRELLNQIPGVTVGGNLVGGASYADAIPDSPFEPVTLSINGALPYETSVTLDGMPLTNTSFAAEGNVGGGVDLYSMPMTSFDTADIVRGPGANAPSIVDSIGGSFVLHAPGRIETDRFQFSASNDPYGGIVSNASAALRFGRLAAVLTYGINDSPGPLGDQRTISASAAVPATVNGQPFNGCSPGGPSRSCGSYTPNANFQNCFCELQSALLIDGIPVSTGWVQHDDSIALSYDITPSVSAQVFYAGSTARMQQPGIGYLVNFMPGNGYAGSITPGLYSFIGIQQSNIAQASSLLEEKVTAHFGRGVLRLAALQNNSWEQSMQSFRQPDGQYTLYGTGYYTASPNTPVNFNGTSALLSFAPYSEKLGLWVNNRALLTSYAEQVGSASNVGISYVTSYYNDPYEINCILPSPFSFSQSPAVSETTRELRLYAGAELSRKLSVNASWYLAQGTYHVVNPVDPDTWVDTNFPYSAPRLGAVWRADRDVVIRAAAGGGYALPPVNYLIGTNFVYCTTTCSQFLTNLNLKPEKSFGFDLGADVRLHYDTVLSFDLYRTNLYGQFFQSTNLTGTYTGFPLYTTQYGNLSQSRYEGINIDISHDVQKGIYWHGALGLTRAYVVSVPSGFYDQLGPCGSGPNSVNTYIIPGMNFDGEFQSTVPYANGSAQLGYRWAPNKYIDLSPTYYGNGNPYFEPAFIEFDANAGYALTKNVSLLATFRNITGAYGQNYQYLSRSPILGAPTIAGPPYALFGIPYGPRSLTLTINFRSSDN